ncbi:MAG TPA: ABC transporter permease [Terriglobia bacterium]|nr:ABC transporter permease [Terriglobia bacterium]
MRIPSFLPIETIRLALDAIRSNKFRSILTVLGIIVGVTTVVAVASILTGLRTSITSMVEEYGTNNIYAFHLSTGPRVGNRDRSEYQRKPLSKEDGRAILQQASAVESVSNVAFLWRLDSTLQYRDHKYRQGSLIGVSAAYPRITNAVVKEGRFISEADDSHKREVLVIGPNVADSLFPNYKQVVGTTVTLGGRPFEIIGVLEKRKNTFFGESNDDNTMLIPFETGRKLSPSSDDMMLQIRAQSGMMDKALGQVEAVLRHRRGLKYNEMNDFDLQTATRIIEQFDSITMLLGIVAIAISSVGLLVGGIGVMNIMLVTVTERTREIGIRKAIGARKRDIVRQFLFEAMTLTSFGGIVGVIVAVIISSIIMLLVPGLPASIPLWAIIAGLGVSTAIGLIFGVWPARKAANLDPIECLRYE